MIDAQNVISFSWQEAGQPEATRRFIAADAPELVALQSEARALIAFLEGTGFTTTFCDRTRAALAAFDDLAK